MEGNFVLDLAAHRNVLSSLAATDYLLDGHGCHHHEQADERGWGATSSLLVLVEVERRAPKDTLSNILNTQEYVRFSLTVSLHIDGVVCT
jgi:hypothetical protein